MQRQRPQRVGRVKFAEMPQEQPANSEQLTPNSDAAAVARMVLAAHDAAETAGHGCDGAAPGLRRARSAISGVGPAGA